MYLGELVRLVLQELVQRGVLFKMISDNDYGRLTTKDAFLTKYISEAAV